MLGSSALKAGLRKYLGSIVDCINSNKSSAGRFLHKMNSYASIYEELLFKYVGQEVALAEIGIGYGGCLQMWREYLGDKSSIFGIDSGDRLLYEEPQIKCFLADQSQPETIESVAKQLPELDIFIDDAGHFSHQQISTFNIMFSKLKRGGLYFCEDTHTSYRELYEGGYKKSGTFIEFCKDLTDVLNCTEYPYVEFSSSARAIHSVSFYASLVVIRKVL